MQAKFVSMNDYKVRKFSINWSRIGTCALALKQDNSIWPLQTTKRFFNFKGNCLTRVGMKFTFLSKY